ncbi:MAG: 3-deoxy-D-manno-octulosonic acid transferase [Planctomyces sp.]
MMLWLLNIVYLMLLTTISPVILWRSYRHGRYRRGIAEKLLGQLPLLSREKPVVWFHAVSVGEVVQLQKVVSEFLKATGDQFQILVTSSTDTGFDLAVKRFPAVTVSWFPLDFSSSVSRALNRVRPVMVVLMELELWPGFIVQAHRQGIPVAVVNGRMSDRSVRRFRMIRPLFSPVLRRLSLIAAQSDAFAERLVSLGAPAARTSVTGSIKFDGVATDRNIPGVVRLRSLFGIRENEIVFIAGSTQSPEEETAVNAWLAVRKQYPDLRLILVPRHQERFDEVAALCIQKGIPLVRRSKLGSGGLRETDQSDKTLSSGTGSVVQRQVDSPESPVILLDTIGELSACWGLADIAFVGGSFGSRGGQNMIEPAAFGAVITFGPNTSNFRDVVQAFRCEEACVQMERPEELQELLNRLTSDADLRRELGDRARKVVLAQQGATAKTVNLLVDLLKESHRNSSESTGIPEGPDLKSPGKAAA